MRPIAAILLIGCCLAAVAPACPQDFKVVWTTLGDVSSSAREAAPVQPGSKVVRVEVEPAVLPVALGKQVCISSLEKRAFGPDGRALAGAPLSIAIREDQKLQLQLTRPKGDICMRPASAGEYPIRFTSKLLAPDGTKRGAQIFLRVS
jgi:hypothetical protein